MAAWHRATQSGVDAHHPYIIANNDDNDDNVDNEDEENRAMGEYDGDDNDGNVNVNDVGDTAGSVSAAESSCHVDETDRWRLPSDRHDTGMYDSLASFKLPG